MPRVGKLRDDEIRERVERLDGWDVVDEKLHRLFRFEGFVQAFGFMASLALVAEANDHHPEWSNVYNRVTIDLTTHDAAGISVKDFELAEAANRLYAPYEA